MDKKKLLKEGFQVTLTNRKEELSSIICFNNDHIKRYGQVIPRANALILALEDLNSNDNDKALKGARDLSSILFGEKIIDGNDRNNKTFDSSAIVNKDQ